MKKIMFIVCLANLLESCSKDVIQYHGGNNLDGALLVHDQSGYFTSLLLIAIVILLSFILKDVNKIANNIVVEKPINETEPKPGSIKIGDDIITSDEMFEANKKAKDLWSDEVIVINTTSRMIQKMYRREVRDDIHIIIKEFGK